MLGNPSAFTFSYLFGERIAISLFNFAVNIAKIASRKKWNEFFSTHFAWKPWFRGALVSRSMCFNSVPMKFAKTMAGVLSFALIYFANLLPVFPKEWGVEFKRAPIVPSQMANLAERLKIFRRIVSPVSVAVMDVKNYFGIVGVAIFAIFFTRLSRDLVHRALGRPWFFHEWTIAANLRAV